MDCPGCAWPDPKPGEEGIAEFCENGAKAVAEKTTARRCTPEFFAEHSIAELREFTDYELGRAGRLTTPMRLVPGDTHYRPISYEEAYDEIAAHLGVIKPEEAVFYPSGCMSNEAAFMYQLLARRLGTNNLPDCSHMCHESSGAALDREFGFAAPRKHGYDTVEAIRAMRDGAGRFFMAMGGNFVRATPDTAVTEAAMARVDLTVHVSTKLNGSHLHPGATSIILPTLGRTDEDRQAGRIQSVSVEDSMGMVHASTGRCTAHRGLHSEPRIVAEIGHRTFGEAYWRAMADDYRVARRHIEATVPGFERYAERIAAPGGFALPVSPGAPSPRERRFGSAIA